MGSTLTLRRGQTALVVVDMQTRLLPLIHQHEQVTHASAALVKAARLFGCPIVATVQYVQGLGETHEVVSAALDEAGAAIIEKAAFSVCRDRTSREAIEQTGRPDIIICGIESHVCVAQTVLDLLDMGKRPFVCADAVSSRYPNDREQALARMSAAGAVITTTEAAMFELCEVSGTDEFKKMLGLVKGLDAHR